MHAVLDHFYLFHDAKLLRLVHGHGILCLVAELGRRPAHLPVTGEVVQVLEILLTSLLLFFLNSLLLLLFRDPVSLLFHDELMDATLVDMQLIVATVLLSVDLPDFFFNNRTALLHSH